MHLGDILVVISVTVFAVFNFVIALVVIVVLFVVIVVIFGVVVSLGDNVTGVAVIMVYSCN